MRGVVACLLAVIAGAAGWVVARPLPGPGPAGGADAAATVTGVMSPRRAPEVLRRLVGTVELERQLDAILADPGFAAAEEESCLIVERGDDRLYGRHVDRPVIPASTLKVLTGSAAVSRFGADHRFITQIRAPAPPGDGAVEGLWLVGAGDPLLATADYVAHLRNPDQPYTRLEALADAVVAAGVRVVRGGVAGDETAFDEVRYLATWKPSYLTASEIGPLSALIVNDNFVEYRTRKVAAAAPAVHAAAVLTDLLRARGVEVAAPPREGKAPSSATAIAEVASPPVAEVVGQMLRESDNVTAEALVKAMGLHFGAGGTWPAGLAVIAETMPEGLAAGLVQRDGSGLERDNRVTCALLLDALEATDPAGPVAAGFPVAGRSGTLADRFRGTPVEGRLRAKTGSLDHVAGLVGWAEAGGGLLELALVGNGLPRPAAAGRDFQARVAAALVAWPAAPAADLLGPSRDRPLGRGPARP